MAKLLTLLCARVLAVGIVGWRRSMARLSAGLRRAAQWLRERCLPSGESASVWRGLPAVRQQLVDATVQLGGQPGENVPEVEPGVRSIELGRLQQAHDDRRALAGELTADEQPVAAIMR